MAVASNSSRLERSRASSSAKESDAREVDGRRPVPFPADVSRVLVEPRRDPTSVQALVGVIDAYDRILERAVANLGADRPAVITTSPFVADFSPLRWASRVTFYAWHDW